jgi:hypothetical protein
MARRFQNFQSNAAECNLVTIVQGSKRIFRLGGSAEIDRGTDPIAQFQVTGDKISMEMSEENVLDFEGMIRGKRDVLVGVALWVNDSCRGCRLVSNQVGGVRQTR